MVKKIKKVVKNELKKSPKISSKRQLNNCDFDEPKKFKKSKQHSSLPGAIVEPNNSIISNNNSSVWVTLQTSNIHELESVELNKNKNENNCEIEIKKEILDIDDQIVETAEVELNKNKIVNPEIAQVVVNKKNNSKDFPISDDSPEKLKKGVESKNKNYVEDQDSDTSGHLPLPSDDDAPGILSIEEKRVHNEKNKQDQEKIVDLETKKSKKNRIEFEENENKKNKITEKIENKNSSSKGKVKFDLSGSGDSGESENEEFHSQKKSEKNKKVDSPILKNQEIKKGSTALKNSEIKNVEYTQKDLPSSDSEKDDDEDSTKISTQNKKNPDKNLDDSPSKAKRKMKKKKSKKILSPSKIALVDSDDSDDSGVDENNLKKLNEVKKKLEINSPSNSADLSGKNKKEKDFSWAGKRVQVVKDLPSSETSPERMTLDDKNLTSRGIQTIESSIRREDENSGDEEEKSVPPRPRKMRKKMIRRGEKHKIPRPEVVQEVFSGFENDDDEDDDDDDDESGNDKPREISDEKAMKLRRMKIKLSHEPPPQHFIEKLAGSRPLSDDDRVEFEKYVKLKKGTFESDEDEIIKRNWEDFCLVNDWDKRDFKPFLYLRHNYKYFLPTVEERKKFLRYLGRDLNNRCLYSILNRFHILYTKTKSSRYSKDEDKFIMKCMKNPGIKNKCSMIGKQLNRTNQSVWRRIKILEREHCTPGHKTATKKKKLDDNNDVSLKKKKKKKIN